MVRAEILVYQTGSGVEGLVAERYHHALLGVAPSARQVASSTLAVPTAPTVGRSAFESANRRHVHGADGATRVARLASARFGRRHAPVRVRPVGDAQELSRARSALVAAAPPG